MRAVPMSAAGGSRAGHRPAGAASAAGAAGASSKKGVAAGAGAGAVGTASAASVAEKEAERSVDVRSILKKKEDEVKEMLAPEKEMYGEWSGWRIMDEGGCCFLLLPRLCLPDMIGERRFRCVPLL